MKKILITGGNGYIGSRLALELTAAGHRVTPLCFPEKPQDRQWIEAMDEVLIGDITQHETIKMIAEKDYEVIIHLVSLDHHDSNGAPDQVAKVNVMPLWNLLDAAVKRGSLKKLIYFSTVQVYGRIAPGVINEQTAINPVNTYGLTHYMCEEVCNYYNNNSDIDCINVRLSNSYAAPVFPDANCWWLVINDLCRQTIEEGKITLLSDGSPQRDFIYHTDVVKAIHLLINSDSTIDNTFNLSSGTTYTILEIASIISKVYKKKYNTSLPIFTPNGLTDLVEYDKKLSRIIIDNSSLKKNIDFEAEIDIEMGINFIFKYFEPQQK